MDSTFDRLMWETDLITLAEQALDHGFSALYDEVIVDRDAWNHHAIRHQLEKLADTVPELAQEATRFHGQLG